MEQPRGAEVECRSQALANPNQVGRDGRARQQWEGRGIESKDSRNSVADPNCLREPQSEGGKCDERRWVSNGSEELAYSGSEHVKRIIPSGFDQEEWSHSRKRQTRSQGYGHGWWEFEPDVGRAFDGLACGLDGSAANG